MHVYVIGTVVIKIKVVISCKELSNEHLSRADVSHNYTNFLLLLRTHFAVSYPLSQRSNLKNKKTKVNYSSGTF